MHFFLLFQMATLTTEKSDCIPENGVCPLHTGRPPPRSKFRYFVLTSEDRFPLCHGFEHKSIKKNCGVYRTQTWRECKRCARKTLIRLYFAMKSGDSCLVGFFFFQTWRRCSVEGSRGRSALVYPCETETSYHWHSEMKNGASANKSKNLIVSKSSLYIERAVALNTYVDYSDCLSNKLSHRRKYVKTLEQLNTNKSQKNETHMISLQMNLWQYLVYNFYFTVMTLAGTNTAELSLHSRLYSARHHISEWFLYTTEDIQRIKLSLVVNTLLLN